MTRLGGRMAGTYARLMARTAPGHKRDGVRPIHTRSP